MFEIFPAIRVAKNIKLFEPNMILMVHLMIETLAKKLEEAAWFPAPIVKTKVFGKQFHAICSGGAYLNPAYIDTFKKYGITIFQGYNQMPEQIESKLGYILIMNMRQRRR